MNLNISSSRNNCKGGDFFTLQGSSVTLNNNGIPVQIPINQITNVRLIKQRNLALNVFAFLSSMLIFVSCLRAFTDNYYMQSLVAFIVFCLLVAAFCVKRYSYKLLINKGKGNYNELQLTKNNLTYAKYFMSLVKEKKAHSYSDESFSYAAAI